MGPPLSAAARLDITKRLFPTLAPDEPKKRRELSLELRFLVVGMFLGGTKSTTQIAKELNKPESTISDIISSLKRDLCLPTATVRTGRPPRLTRRMIRGAIREVYRNRQITAKQLTLVLSPIISVGTATLKKALYRHGFASRIAARKPYLMPRHRFNRLLFAKQHENWTIEQWSKVIWTDESSFEIGKNYRQVRVWRRMDERFLEHCLVPTFKSGRTSIMVWGAFCGDLEKCQLVRMPKGKQQAVDHIEYVYEQAISGYYHHASDPSTLILMEDGASTHRAIVSRLWREAYGVPRMVWPAQSPDLNPIENVWRLMKAYVSNRPIPADGDEMWVLLKEAWESVSQEFLQGLLESMPARMKAVIEAKGGPTRW